MRNLVLSLLACVAAVGLAKTAFASDLDAVLSSPRVSCTDFGSRPVTLQFFRLSENQALGAIYTGTFIGGGTILGRGPRVESLFSVVPGMDGSIENGGHSLQCDLNQLKRALRNPHQVTDTSNFP